LSAHHQHFLAVEARHPANHRSVVAKCPVAMNLRKVSKDMLNVIQHIGTLRVPRQFRALPRIEVRVHLLA